MLRNVCRKRFFLYSLFASFSAKRLLKAFFLLFTRDFFPYAENSPSAFFLSSLSLAVLADPFKFFFKSFTLVSFSVPYVSSSIPLLFYSLLQVYLQVWPNKPSFSHLWCHMAMTFLHNARKFHFSFPHPYSLLLSWNCSNQFLLARRCTFQT